MTKPVCGFLPEQWASSPTASAKLRSIAAVLSWSANYFRYFDQVLTTVIGSRKIPGRKIRLVNWYSIFLPHIFLLLAVGFELPNQYQLIFADELNPRRIRWPQS
jgi:hypothetical protein